MIIDREVTAPGQLNFRSIDKSYQCGECRGRVFATGGRKRVGNKWICPACVPLVSLARKCCTSVYGKQHKAGCPMARPSVSTK